MKKGYMSVQGMSGDVDAIENPVIEQAGEESRESRNNSTSKIDDAWRNLDTLTEDAETSTESTKMVLSVTSVVI